MLQKLDPKLLRMHKGVSFVGVTTIFLCHDGKGKFFMARRTENARDEKGNWEPGSGGLKWGQAVEESLRCEVKEEYGAEVLELEFLGYHDMFRKLEDGTPTHWLGLSFAVLVNPKQVKNLEPEIHSEVGWFTRENLPSPLHSQVEAFFKLYKNQLDTILGTD